LYNAEEAEPHDIATMPLAKKLALSALTSLIAKPAWDRLVGRSTVNYKGHVPLAGWENAVAAVGSGVVGLADTKRGGESGGGVGGSRLV
jgi:hypothetical protein